MTDHPCLEVPFDEIEKWEKIKGSCARLYAAAEWGYKQALATPPPEPPTDEELWAIGDEDFRTNYYATDAIKYARAVLERWGK